MGNRSWDALPWRKRFYRAIRAFVLHERAAAAGAVIAGIVTLVLPMTFWPKVILIAIACLLAVRAVWDKEATRLWSKAGRITGTLIVFGLTALLAAKSLIEPDKHPSVGLFFADPKEPVVAPYNDSDVPVREFSYQTYMVDLDSPNKLNILPIDTVGGFLRPHSKMSFHGWVWQGRIRIKQLTGRVLEVGNRLLGTVAITCSECLGGVAPFAVEIQRRLD